MIDVIVITTQSTNNIPIELAYSIIDARQAPEEEHVHLRGRTSKAVLLINMTERELRETNGPLWNLLANTLVMSKGKFVNIQL